MDYDIVADLKDDLERYDRVHSPEAGIRVMATIDGERIQVGTGHIDAEGMFQANITDDRAEKLFDTYIMADSFSLEPEVDMVKRQPGKLRKAAVTQPVSHRRQVKAKTRAKNKAAGKTRKKNRD